MGAEEPEKAGRPGAVAHVATAGFHHAVLARRRHLGSLVAVAPIRDGGARGLAYAPADDIDAFAARLGMPVFDAARLTVAQKFAPALARLDPETVRHVVIGETPQGPLIAIAPPPEALARLDDAIARTPALRRRIVLTHQATIARKIVACRRAVLDDVARRPVRLLAVAGVDDATIAALEAAAAEAIDPFVIAIRRGLVGEEVLARALADITGCAHAARCAVSARVAPPPAESLALLTTARVVIDGAERIAAVPSAATLPRLIDALRRNPGDAGRIVITSRATIIAAYRRQFARRDCNAAVRLLEMRQPGLSAARTVTGMQGLALVGALSAAVIAISIAPAITSGAMVMLALAVILAVTWPRAAAAMAPTPDEPGGPCLADAALPTYSVLVPLFREEASIPGLVAALRGLDYPPEKLDIKLVVEADDAVTRAAIACAERVPTIDIIAVPAIGPRTKPKALGYALPFASGDIVTIFDAEDRPEPDQLRRVAAIFAAEGADLGCVQAHLAIDHPGDTWFSHQFALEYVALFDRLLPWMAKRRLAFPLGGTSNHIKRAALDAVGGWDPFNVTEDADLGIRLARFGWRLSTVASTTFEEAPLSFRPWFAQRTRWYKGWLQTWLVHMRAPYRLLRELGPANFALFQILIGGGLAVLGFHLALGVLLGLYAGGVVEPPRLFGPNGPTPFLPQAVVGIVGFLAPALLIRRAARQRGLKAPLVMIATLPLYWLLMALALAAAVLDLIRRPVHWAKTEHGLAERPAPRSRPLSRNSEPGKSPAAARQERC